MHELELPKLINYQSCPTLADTYELCNMSTGCLAAELYNGDQRSHKYNISITSLLGNEYEHMLWACTEWRQLAHTNTGVELATDPYRYKYMYTFMAVRF